ncbi:triple gene block protein 2 [Banana virus X]|uniref:Movement protein TGB2 n=1 Tax=Banana virus X TaxID=307671 RepID=Q5IJQ2_9VIRU|nr:triple gene block protein 2 [Banana virus X]AAW50960.1 triple gene block protein 2 [Banana virus X]
MSLRQPENFSGKIVPVCVSVTIGVILFFLTKSNLPHVGDNIHSLPHGGTYIDGSKKINYCSPQKNFPGNNLLRTTGSLFHPAILVFLLILAIYASSRLGNRRVIIGTCNSPHCQQHN